MQPAQHREREAPPTAAQPVRLGPRDFILDRKSDGTIYIRSPHKLDPYPDKITERLVHWAERTPDRVFMADRDAGGLAQVDLRRHARAHSSYRGGAAHAQPVAGAANRHSVRQ